jgi:hypothetical protein
LIQGNEGADSTCPSEQTAPAPAAILAPPDTRSERPRESRVAPRNAAVRAIFSQFSEGAIVSKNQAYPPKPASSHKAERQQIRNREAAALDGGDDAIQGEGDYDAARNFDDAEQAFVEDGKVEAAAAATPPRSSAEEKAMLAAERAGKGRAR